MRNQAIRLKEFGSIENLKLENISIPEIESNEVLVKVYCAGISFADILIVEGKYQDAPELPFVPGLEVSGIIEKVGKEVQGLKEGDEVVGLSAWGAFAEYVKLDSKFVVRKSENMSFEVAASMTINYGTSYYALVERARIREGQKILILGASGGIGLSAIEISKAFNCNVTAVASSKEKLETCEKYGADNLILNNSNNLKESLKEQQAGKFDLIYDTIGGQDTIDSFSFVEWEGQILIMGFASGDIASVPVNKILLKGCNLIGIFWGPFARGNTNFNLQSIKEVCNLYEKGLLKISAPDLYLINDFKEAMSKIKNRESIGKLCFYTEAFSKS